MGCSASPYSLAQAFSTPGELISSGVARFRQTQRDEAVTGYKFRQIGVTSERQGPRLTVGEALQLHWVATARLKPGSPRSVRFYPVTLACSTGCVELRGTCPEK